LRSLHVHFDPAGSDACIAAAVDVFGNCKGDTSGAKRVCDGLLVGDVSEGGGCTDPRECAPAADMSGTTCMPDATHAASAHCVVVPPTPRPPRSAKLDETCTTTCRSSTTDACVDISGAERTLACLAVDGLVCDADTRLCVAAPAVGGACTGFCAPGAYC